jgi:hypothetical protein
LNKHDQTSILIQMLFLHASLNVWNNFPVKLLLSGQTSGRWKGEEFALVTNSIDNFCLRILGKDIEMGYWLKNCVPWNLPKSNGGLCLDALKQRCQSSPVSFHRACSMARKWPWEDPRPGKDMAGLRPKEEETTSNIYLVQFRV